MIFPSTCRGQKDKGWLTYLLTHSLTLYLFQHIVSAFSASPGTSWLSLAQSKTSDGLFINLYCRQSRPDENGVQTTWTHQTEAHLVLLERRNKARLMYPLMYIYHKLKCYLLCLYVFVINRFVLLTLLAVGGICSVNFLASWIHFRIKHKWLHALHSFGENGN